MLNSISPVSMNKVAFKGEIPEQKLQEKEADDQ